MKPDFKKFFETHKEKINKSKEFILIVIGYGLLINYALIVIAKVPFLWYGFPAFGIVYYFIMEEFVDFFRKLKAKTFT
jgi:hypothetical protein